MSKSGWVASPESSWSGRYSLALLVPAGVSLTTALVVFGLSFGQCIGLWAAGWGLWTAMEYVLHRCLFHSRWRGPEWVETIRREHGRHHREPLSNAVGALAVVSIALILATTGLSVFGHFFLPVFAGAVSGYVAYQFLHWHFHRYPDAQWFRWSRGYHERHHRDEPDRAFAVSLPLWDLLLGTWPLGTRR